MDTDGNRAASLCQRYGAGYYTTNAQEIISDPKIEIVFVASTHSTHADYAIEALRARKHVHIEKPHIVSQSQLDRLVETMRSTDRRISLGFNRTVSPLAERIFRELSKQEGGIAASWAVIGHPIAASHWYARPEEGGRVFGNLCHWTDFLYTMVPRETRYPIRVRGLKVSDSEIALTLSFSDKHIASITFSALGDTFEGVRETLTVQRGNLIASLKDFKQLIIDIGPLHRRYRPWFQDHGHEERIVRSMSLLRSDSPEPCSIEYVRGTGELFLGASEALATGQEVVLEKPGQ